MKKERERERERKKERKEENFSTTRVVVFAGFF